MRGNSMKMMCSDKPRDAMYQYLDCDITQQLPIHA